MNRGSSDSQTTFRDKTRNAPLAPLSKPTIGDSPWCDQNYFPTLGERQLLAWLVAATDLPGKATIRMALLVLQSAATCGRKQHLAITPQRLATTEMSRVAAYEGLRWLESAGLVSVKRCRGRSPLVTILDAIDTP